MRKKRRMWVGFDFLPFEGEVVERYLEEASLKGWKLKKASNKLLKFERVEKKRIKYFVDINKETEIINGKPSNEILEYREKYKAVGWDFVCQCENVQIFSSENLEVERIYIEERERKEIINKALIRHIILNLAMIFILALNIYNIIGFDSKGEFLADRTRVIALGTIIIYGLIAASNLIRIGVWKFSKTPQRSFYRSLKIKNLLLNLNTIVIMIILLKIIIFDGESILKGMLLMLGIGFVLGGMYLINRIIEKRIVEDDFLKKCIQLIMCTIGVIIIIFLIIGREQDNNIDKQSERKRVLRLEEFTGKKEKKMLYFEKCESIFAKLEKADLQGENLNINYNIFKGKYDFITDFRVDRFRKEEENVKKRHGEQFYEKIKVDFIKDMEVYSNFEKTKYILYGNKIFCELDFWRNDEKELRNREELLKIAYNKIKEI